MTSRSAERGSKALAAVTGEIAGAEVDLLTLDVTSVNSVNEAARKVKEVRPFVVVHRPSVSGALAA